MSNRFQSLSAEDALLAAKTVTSKIVDAPNVWGISETQLSVLTDGFADLQAKVAAQNLAQVAAKAPTVAKATARERLIAGLVAASKSAYATPDVTDVMLTQIGFAPRQRGGTRPLALLAPTRVMASALPEGLVKLRWDRNWSVQGTIFTVETSANGLDFTLLKATTRASLRLEGVAAWFRIRASRGNLTSPPSALVHVYAPGLAARPALRAA